MKISHDYFPMKIWLKPNDTQMYGGAATQRHATRGAAE